MSKSSKSLNRVGSGLERCRNAPGFNAQPSAFLRPPSPWSKPPRMSALKLAVVFVSTRPQRVGLPVARWFVEVAKEQAAFEVDWVDLREVNLPLFDESRHPKLRQYEHAHTKAWSARVEAADAFVFVTPEYNFSAPPALINCLDYLFLEWNYKPCAFVSYGGGSGGLRSVQHAKSVATALKMMPIPEAVSLPMFTKLIVDGELKPEARQVEVAKDLLAELKKWAVALKPMRPAK